MIFFYGAIKKYCRDDSVCILVLNSFPFRPFNPSCYLTTRIVPAGAFTGVVSQDDERK